MAGKKRLARSGRSRKHEAKAQSKAFAVQTIDIFNVAEKVVEDTLRMEIAEKNRIAWPWLFLNQGSRDLASTGSNSM